MTSELNKLFELQEIIGYGCYGVVHKALNKETNSIVALKLIKLSSDSIGSSMSPFFFNEVSCLKQALSKHVTKLIKSYENLVMTHSDTQVPVLAFEMDLIGGGDMFD